MRARVVNIVRRKVKEELIKFYDEVEPCGMHGEINNMQL